MKATLTFKHADAAAKFASQHSHKWAEGHDMSAVDKDGSRRVTVYNVSPEKQAWIEAYIAANGGV